MRTGLWVVEADGPSVRSCRRWMRDWIEDGSFAEFVKALADDLTKRGRIDCLWTNSWEHRTIQLLLSQSFVAELATGASPLSAWPGESALVLLVTARPPLPQGRSAGAADRQIWPDRRSE